MPRHRCIDGGGVRGHHRRILASIETLAQRHRRSRHCTAFLYKQRRLCLRPASSDVAQHPTPGTQTGFTELHNEARNPCRSKVRYSSASLIGWRTRRMASSRPLTCGMYSHRILFASFLGLSLMRVIRAPWNRSLSNLAWVEIGVVVHLAKAVRTVAGVSGELIGEGWAISLKRLQAPTRFPHTRRFFSRKDVVSVSDGPLGPRLSLAVERRKSV